MTNFETRVKGVERNAIAPDGSEVRFLAVASRGGMAHFKLGAGEVSRAVVHWRVEEVWYFLAGRGEMWRKNSGGEEVIEVFPELSLAIPVDTSFQFRATGDRPLEAIGVTMPPWKDEKDASVVDGIWPPTV